MVKIGRAGGVALIALLIACGPRRRAPPVPRPPSGEVWLEPARIESAGIRTELVAERFVGGTIRTSGKVAFDDLSVSHVFSPVSGRVVQILAGPGERVTRGAPLAVIDSPDLGGAFADLEKAEAEVVRAERAWRRQRELFSIRATAQKDVDEAQEQYAAARAEQQRAREKARLLHASAHRDTQRYTLRAPLEGDVIVRKVNPGVEVQGQYAGGQSGELFIVGELDPVWVLADLFEVDLGRVQRGARITVTSVAYPGQAFEGAVEWIAAALDPETRTAHVRCTLPNPRHQLHPEMFVTVTIAVGGRHVPTVPRGAILRLADQPIVFVELGRTADGRIRFARRPVAIGEDEGGPYLPVQRNLAIGDRVVTGGAILLSGML
jgi:cobalt-zinc-cadmium efflux system membrane fusion protein